MNLNSVFVSLFGVAVAAAFVASPMKGCRHSTTKMFGYRQSYQYSLEKLMETGHMEINGQEVSLDQVSEQMRNDLQMARDEGADAESRRDLLAKELLSKVAEQVALGTETSDPGVLAKESSSAAMENFKQREKMLQSEMDVLRQKLEQEEERIRQARTMSNTILQARIDIDKELGLLKKQYQEERKQWEKALSVEQEARRIEVFNTQRELDALHLEIDELVKKSEVAALTAVQAEVLAGKLQDAEQLASTLKQSREKLDAELTAMKQKYEADMKAWEKNMELEQSAREEEASKAKEEMESLKSELSKLKEERGDFGSLINLSFKALFGLED